MRKNSTLFCLIFSGILLIASLSTKAQSEGDYRSNITTLSGLWSAPGSWQTYSDGSWVAATSPPTSSTPIVTISAGDSVVLNASTNVGTVNVAAGGTLAIYNLSSTLATATLVNNITVDGRLYVGTFGAVSGTGVITINSNGLLGIRNGGRAQANIINNGYAELSSSVLENSTFTNNNIVLVLGGPILIGNNGTFLNNASVTFTLTTGPTVVEGITGTTNRNFTNSSSGILFKPNTGQTLTINSSVTFTNNGILKGFGEFQFANVGVNNGTVAPGNSPGIISVNSSFLSAKTTTLQLELSSTGAIPGVHYDQIVISGGAPTNINNLILVVTDNANDPIGTIYTLMSTSTTTLTGAIQPLNITLPPTLSNLTLNPTGTALTVERTGVLPVTWGYFFISQQNGSIKLNWETIQESNNKSFDIEYASDNKAFSTIGSVAATNTNRAAFYTFTHTPLQSQVHKYRIKQIDLDGKFTYSSIKTVKDYNDSASNIQIGPNPFIDNLTIRILDNKSEAFIYSITGKLLHKVTLFKGSNVVALSDLSSGTYIIKIINENKNSYQQKIIKR